MSKKDDKKLIAGTAIAGTLGASILGGMAAVDLLSENSPPPPAKVILKGDQDRKDLESMLKILVDDMEHMRARSSILALPVGADYWKELGDKAKEIHKRVSIGQPIDQKELEDFRDCLSSRTNELSKLAEHLKRQSAQWNDYPNTPPVENKAHTKKEVEAPKTASGELPQHEQRPNNNNQFKITQLGTDRSVPLTQYDPSTGGDGNNTPLSMGTSDKIGGSNKNHMTISQMGAPPFPNSRTAPSGNASYPDIDEIAKRTRENTGPTLDLLRKQRERTLSK